MIKALMIITMVSGTEYTANLPTMEQCMKETVPVVSQNDVKSASCIPRTEDMLPSEILSQFMDLFFMMEEQKEWGDPSKITDPCFKSYPNFWEPGEDYFPPKP